MNEESEIRVGERNDWAENTGIVENGEESSSMGLVIYPQAGGDRVAELEEALNAERGRNKRLNDEINHLLDDMDRLEERLKLSDDDIDQLLFERKKLQLKLDSYAFKKKDFEAVRNQIEMLRIKVSEQEKILDDQQRHIDQQDYLIHSLETELDEKKEKSTESRSQRIDDGIKKYHDSKMEMKEKAILKLKHAVDLLQEKKASERENTKLAAANETIEMLEAKVEDLQLELKAMQETKRKENQILTKSTYAAHEWRQRAESAERKLAEYGKNIDDNQINDFKGGESDQGLLLQGVMAKKEKMKNGWGLGGIFGGDVIP